MSRPIIVFLLALNLLAWSSWATRSEPVPYHGPVHVVEPERVGRVG